jgi:hypothetical protein
MVARQASQDRQCCPHRRIVYEPVSEGEGDVLVLADVSEPVPGEHALGSDDRSIAVGLDGLEEELGIGAEVLVDDDVVGLIEDADVHGSGVELEAGIESVILVLVETHQKPPLGWDRA